jgi:hypothetical protein
MPLKFVTNQIDLENGNITIQDGTTPTSKVIPTPTVLSDETGSANFVPESVTDGDGSATGFSLSFTDGSTYDIDEILFNIRRDNPESPLLMEVVSENSQYELLIQLSTQEILNEYFNQNFLTDNPEVIPNINLIPNFALLLEARYQQKLQDLEYIEDNELAEGSLAINSAQPKIGVKKDDMVKYLLSDRPAKRVTPLVNLNRPLAIWNDLTTDLNTPNNFEYFENLGNVILDLQGDIDANDGGDFEILDLDGGSFTENITEIEDGGAF